jgi:hypothetical protein
MDLPQEHWRERTLFEIASAIGMPLALDEATKNRTSCQYARILVDLDLSQRIFYDILVEREGYTFKLSVVYERLPEFCHHCHVVGHNVSICKWLYPPKVELKIDIKKNELHEVNKTIAIQEYVAKAIAQSEVLLQ